MADQERLTEALIPQHELAADIDSMRMGLWWLMMHRGHGHLAHRVLRTGMVAMQRLWMLCAWDEYDADEFVLVQDACQAFYFAAVAAAESMGDKGQVAKYRKRVEQLGQTLYNAQRLQAQSKGPVYRGMGKAVVEYRARRGWNKYTRKTMESMPPVGPVGPVQGELFEELDNERTA